MAGLNLAGVFSAQARQQYGAVAAMRWQMLRHSLRTRRGGFELGARIFATSFFALVALAVGIGLGFGAYAIASGPSLYLLVAIFWPVFVLWQSFPVMAASFQEHVDMSAVLRFPMGFASYMLVTLVFGLFDITSVMGGICLCGIWTGLVVAQPHAVRAITLSLVLFAVFNLLLTRMIFAWIDRWLAQRRTREILGASFLFLMLSFQLINPALQHSRGHRPPVGRKTLHAVNRAQSFLPPGLAADAIGSAIRGRQAQSLLPAGALALYGVGAGLLLGFRLHAEYRGENLGEASPPSLGAQRSVRASAVRRFRGGSGPVGAVIEKELRYLSRSGVMLYSMAAPLVLLFVFGRGSGVSFAGRFALPVGVAYSFLGLTRMIYNSLGGEGAGIQLYFTSPTPFRTIMLSKNLVQLALLCFELGLICLIVQLRYGMPDTAVVAATFCWLLFALPLQLAAGNILSIRMAYRMTLSRMSREEGATGNGLISLLIQLVVVGIGAAVFLPLSRYGHASVASGVFLVLAMISSAAWLRVFSNLDRMAAGRREALIQALARAS